VEASAGARVGVLSSLGGGGVGTLSPYSATLLGGGVPAVSSPLVGVLAPALSCTGSSSAVSATATTAGYSTGCSRVVCSAVSLSAIAGSVVPKPTMLLGSTSEAALTKKSQCKLL